MTAPTVEELRAVTTVTITQAGAFIGLSPATSYRAANDGSLPTITVGKHRRVPAPLLLALVGLPYEVGSADTAGPSDLEEASRAGS
ncbi:helix-turn-helix domain-containing protein [Nocardioides piscis]|uniref:Helix-turn-helix domain-containing protein n=1 Tax=Nocardioides piscis TaxID=2714938 RepID=A0A6G7YHE3_9ACTN|nr:helix-turn-helix domain-containing protein [Nocardioides piscis]QIK76037.1 helix-turn-helix domain-containing protein [Nocardioides piscis]